MSRPGRVPSGGGTRAEQEIILVYDKHCPFCDHYCRLVRIRENVGRLTLVDARQPSPVMDSITRAGLDIDQGMVAIVAGERYYGADAMHALALLSSRSGAFNRFNAWVFASRRRARWLYPLLRHCRNGLLKLAGRKKVNNLSRAGNERF